MKLYKNFFLPIGLLSGTIIGAGVFSLPYVFAFSGTALGIFYLCFGAALYALVHLLYADVIVRTPGEHRFVGYASIYLGPKAFIPAVLVSVLGLIFGLTVYLLLSVSFINLAFPGGGETAKLFVFWALGSLAVFLSVKKLALTELLITWGMVAIMALVFALGITRVDWPGLESYTGLSRSLTPLAPIFFSMAGFAAIPSLVKYFRIPGVGHDKKLLKMSVIFGTLIPAVVYAAFIFGVLGLSGQVSEDAVTGLVGRVEPVVLALIGFLGILSIWSSYIVFGVDLKNIIGIDLGLPKIPSALLVIFGPPLLYLAGFRDFLELVSFTGGLFLGLEGIMIIAMWLKANGSAERAPVLMTRLPVFIAALAIAIFAVVLIYETKQFFF